MPKYQLDSMMSTHRKRAETNDTDNPIERVPVTVIVDVPTREAAEVAFLRLNMNPRKMSRIS